MHESSQIYYASIVFFSLKESVRNVVITQEFPLRQLQGGVAPCLPFDLRISTFLPLIKKSSNPRALRPKKMHSFLPLSQKIDPLLPFVLKILLT